MTTEIPNYFAPPSLEAYPFIDILFHRYDIGIRHLWNETDLEQPYSDKAFTAHYFTEPVIIRRDRIAPLLSMNDKTFERLFVILKPELSTGETYRTKADLVALAGEKDRWYDKVRHQNASRQTTFLHHSTLAKNIHWGLLASLYNESTPYQQEAICGYFSKVRNRTLERLMKIPGPTFELPTSLTQTFDSKVEHGEVLLFSEPQQEWLREDIFHHQYRIEGFHHLFKRPSLIATAATLAQAIAKISIFAQGFNMTINMNAFDVLLGGNYVAGGEFHTGPRLRAPTSASDIKAPGKIRWNLDDSAWEPNKTTSAQDQQAKPLRYPTSFKPLVDFNPRSPSCISRNEFIKTLFATEKAMGLQWSKAFKLEDELGL